MDTSNLLSLPLPDGYVVPAALALVAMGVVLLGLTFLILFHGSAGDILGGFRLRAAAATFAGGLFLPSVVVLALLLTPFAHPTFAAGARLAKTGSPASESAAPAPPVAPPAAPAVAAPAATPVPAPARPAVPAVSPAAPTAKATTASAAPATPDPAAVARGKALVQEQNCLACHRIDGSGGVVGPDLSDIGHRRDAEWLMRHFKDPQLVSPGTLMPKFQLPDADFAALTAYMLTLLGKQ